MVVLAVPLVVGTQFVAKPLMVLVAGSDYAQAGVILKILIWAAGLVFISCFFSHIVVAVGKQSRIIWAYFFTAITAVAGYLIFIPKYSYFGAAAVTVYSEGIITVFMILYAWRFVGFLPRLKIIGQAMAAAVAMAAALYFFPAHLYDKVWGMFLALSLASIIYFAVLYLAGGITKEDVARLLNRKIGN